MSFWGATVITNLLSPFPSLIEWVCGGHYIYNPTLKKFFLFHFQFPFLLCGFTFLHLFYLHFHSSNNPLRLNTNNKIPFFPFIFTGTLLSHKALHGCWWRTRRSSVGKSFAPSSGKTSINHRTSRLFFGK